jgi:tetratricopeptide (TPR) repeat protein
LFDSAAAASSAGDHASAVDLFTQLEARTTAPRNLAIIRTRKGVALVDLGRHGEARTLLEQAVPKLPRDDATLHDDRIVGLRTLGRIALADINHEMALRYYAQSTAESATPDERMAGLLGEALAGIFIDPAVALGKAQEAESLQAKIGKPPREIMGHIAMVKGRALLNLGRFAEAEKSFASAVKAEGGLSLRVNYDDLVARSDASIAAMLAGHRDSARNYLVYTGAGRMEKQDFIGGADMALPICGEEGIKPDDVAVVEFSILDNGAVGYARPVYGSRSGGMALVFARYVTGWSWAPADVAKIPPLFRFVTRLELRCSVGEGGPALRDSLYAAFNAWADGQGAAPFVPSGEGVVARQAALQAELARIRAVSGDGSIALAPILGMLLASPLVSSPQIREYGALPRPIVMANRPTALARLHADLLAVDMSGRRNRRDLLPSDDAYRGDPEALTTLRLLRYDTFGSGAKARNGAILDAIIADPALPAGHPLHVAALTRRASAKAAAGDLDGARADFRATGLTDQQCSIVDAKPSAKRIMTSPEDYPTDMVTVGIEGWTRVQFDVRADGKAVNQRAVVTYPPMIFGRNGEKIISRSKYEQSYRPDGGLGCGGSLRGIYFKMPE